MRLHPICRSIIALCCALSVPSFHLLHAAEPPAFGPTFNAGTGANEGQGLIIDGSGNLYATGQFAGTGTFGATTLTNGGSFDYFLAKYAPTGQVLWARGAGAAKEDFGSNLALDPDGNVLVVGTLDGAVDFGGQTLSGAGAKDAFVAKYQSDGSLLWVRTAGGTGNDQGFGIGADAAGNVYVAGRIVGAAGFGGLTAGSGSQTRFFIARYDSAGQPVWAKAFAATGSAATGGLVVDAAGNLFVTGMDADHNSVFTAKYDADGNLKWSQQHAADGYFSEGTGIALDAAGDVYVAGRFGTASFTVGDTTLDNPASVPVGFVAKYAPDGTPQWARRAGSRAFAVAATSAGVAYVTGFFNQTADDFVGVSLPFVSGLDAFFARFETDGTLAWAVPAGSFNNDLGRRVAVDPQGAPWAIGEAGQEAFGADWTNGGVFITRFAENAPTEPALTVQTDGDALVVSWPEQFTGYALEYAAQLNAAFQRTGVTVTPVAGKPNTFRVTVPGTTLFIRLGKP